MSAYQNLQRALREERNQLMRELETDCEHYARNTAPTEIEQNFDKIKDNCKIYAEAVRSDIEGKVNKKLLFSSARKVLVVEEAKHLLKQQFEESKQLIALKHAHISEIDAEIASYESKVHDGQAVLRQAEEPLRPTQEVTAVHIARARQRFKKLKEELQHVIKVFFHNSDDVIVLMGKLMEAKTSGNMDVNIADHDERAVNTLLTCEIVATHPYDITKIRLIL